MKRYALFLFACMFICFLTWMRGAAWAVYQEQAALHLLDLINEARINPSKVIERLGIDKTLAREALGGNQWILDQGLTSLTTNQMLFRSASDHSLDMIQHHYYSYDSLDGRKVMDRIAQSGYQASYSGESLGIVAFKTFMDPNGAADFIFLNLVRDELDPGLGGQKNIFSPSSKELGISFEAGSMDLGHGTFNGYLVVVDFARPVETDTGCCDDQPAEPPVIERQDEAELYLWRMINEARAMPLAVVNRVGLDEAQARLALGTDEWILDQGLQPLARNDHLFESAQKHGEDMIENLYYSVLSRDGKTVADRVAEAGYEGVSAGESLAAAGFDVSLDPMDAARDVFINLMNNELNSNQTGQRYVFSNDFRELGIFLAAVTVYVDEGLPVSLYLAVVDFAAPVEPKVYLIGNVFRDLNGDRFLDPDEGVSGLRAIARPFGSTEGTETVTGVLGDYQLEFPTGFVDFLIEDQNGKVLKRQIPFTINANRLLDVWLN